MTLGYPLETYPVETVDGSVLRMYRIPYGKKNATRPSKDKPVVMLFHGVTLSSASFAVLDEESSMAFYLADAGFDVWMPNSRGNTYSRGNRYFKSTETGYWDNSMDELALIDRPTQIDFVLNFTGAASVGTVGHSQGCTLSVMLLAMRPEYIDKIWMLMLLGPVTHSEYIQTPFLRQQAATESAQIMLAQAGVGQFLPNYDTSQMVSGCKIPANTPFCFDLINFMFYGPSKYVSYDDFMRVSATWPATVATRNLAHWSQMFHTRNGIYMYDYGDNCTLTHAMERAYQESCNQMKYGSLTPMQYDLGRINKNLTAVILAGDMDLMATSPDIEMLRQSWNATEVLFKVYKDTAHMDFGAWGWGMGGWGRMLGGRGLRGRGGCPALAFHSTAAPAHTLASNLLTMPNHVSAFHQPLRHDSLVSTVVAGSCFGEVETAQQSRNQQPLRWLDRALFYSTPLSQHPPSPTQPHKPNRARAPIMKQDIINTLWKWAPSKYH